jgi:intracellular septation protein A
MVIKPLEQVDTLSKNVIKRGLDKQVKMTSAVFQSLKMFYGHFPFQYLTSNFSIVNKRVKYFWSAFYTQEC